METTAIIKLEAIDKIVQPDGTVMDEYFFLGFFDSQETCDAMIQKYRSLPGFCFSSCTFHQKAYQFESVDISQVYYVYAVEGSIDYADCSTEIGVFLTEMDAAKAKSEYLSGCTASQMGHTEVCIARYSLNCPEWTEGFDRYTWYEDHE